MLPAADLIEPDPLDVPDPDIAGTRRLLNNASESTVLRLTSEGEIDTYVMRGRRFWKLASIRAYKQRCIDAGPQWGRSKPGRPHRTKTSRASAAE